MSELRPYIENCRKRNTINLPDSLNPKLVEMVLHLKPPVKAIVPYPCAVRCKKVDVICFPETNNDLAVIIALCSYTECDDLIK